MEKYKPNWDTLRKTVTIINEDNSIYAEYDYIDFLQFRVERLQSERLSKQKFYIRNEYGGKIPIDECGDEFPIINELLRKIIKLRC
jgi:hypothetical protein